MAQRQAAAARSWRCSAAAGGGSSGRRTPRLRSSVARARGDAQRRVQQAARPQLAQRRGAGQTAQAGGGRGPAAAACSGGSRGRGSWRTRRGRRSWRRRRRRLPALRVPVELKWTDEDFAEAGEGQLPLGRPTTTGHSRTCAVDAGFKTADLVLDETFVGNSTGHQPLETRTAMAYWQNGKVYIHGSTQSTQTDAVRAR